MPTGHVFMATSLDGFVARKDHSLDWLMKQNTHGEDHGFDDFMTSVDGLIMGSGSFKTVLAFESWP
jgi:dihydrofolate reductase